MDDIKELLKAAKSLNAEVQIHFSDFKENEWTIPQQITDNRIVYKTTSPAVERIRLTIDI